MISLLPADFGALLGPWHQNWNLPHTLFRVAGLCLLFVVIVIALGTFTECPVWSGNGSDVGPESSFLRHRWKRLPY